MATTRYIAGAGSTGGAGTAWNNPENITDSDDVRASRSLTNFAPSSQLLKASDLTLESGDPVPNGASIDAARILVEGHATAAEAKWQDAAFYLDDDIIGAAAASQTITDIGTDAVYTFTPTAELTPAIINDAGFNAQVRATWNSGTPTVRVDAVYVEIDWTPPEPSAGARGAGDRAAADLVMGVVG